MYRAALRDARWLTAERAVAVCRVMLVVMLGLVAAIPWFAPKMQVGRDFAAFWTAARFALDGHAADAYGDPAGAALASLFGPGAYPPFAYPPIALLLWAPFAVIPFAAAVGLWVGVTGAAYAVAIKAVLAGRSLVPAISFPAVSVCALYGQNSLFSAALLGGAAATLDRSPIFAGVLIGCLAYKPQLALLAPIALAAAGRWRAFAAAAVAAALLGAASVLAFGMNSWAAFIGALPAVKAWNADGRPGFAKFISPYAAARLLGESEKVAYAVEAATMAAAAIMLVLVCRRRPGGAPEIAILTVATALSVPFLGLYDYAIFAVPAAWLVSSAIRNGWLPYERIALAALYLGPFLVLLAAARGIPVGPVLSLALGALILRRIHRNG